MSERTLVGVYGHHGFHWVGDGFHVAQVLPGAGNLVELADPFLMMDYHAPMEYPPTETPRGVGVHPHRGFETVTLAFEGAVAHHDSSGGGGVIRKGDAQWMTAASGVLHKEYHEKEWAREGGLFHMMQLWVNLPSANKMDPPGYQALEAAEMGQVSLLGGGNARVIAGELNGVRGPASTFTPIELWELTLQPDEEAVLELPDGHTAMVFVMEGDAEAAGAHVGEEQLAVFDRRGDSVRLRAGAAGMRAIVLGGEPIGEPVVFHGPFAMNTQEEVIQAVRDFNSGKFGVLV